MSERGASAEKEEEEETESVAKETAMIAGEGTGERTGTGDSFLGVKPISRSLGLRLMTARGVS